MTLARRSPLLEDLGYSRDEILRRLRHQIPAGPFRASYAYTNFGLTEAAAARAAGKTWEDLAAERLFRPLGVGRTSYRYADYAAAANRRSSTPASAASGSRGSIASPTPRPRPEGRAPPRATSPGGYARSSPTAISTASR